MTITAVAPVRMVCIALELPVHIHHGNQHTWGVGTDIFTLYLYRQERWVAISPCCDKSLRQITEDFLERRDHPVDLAAQRSGEHRLEGGAELVDVVDAVEVEPDQHLRGDTRQVGQPGNGAAPVGNRPRPGRRASR